MNFLHTFITGPLALLGERALQGDVAPEYVELPEYELPLGDLAVNPAIDWLTPLASVNCSRSSVFVRPLAVMHRNRHFQCYTNEYYCCGIRKELRLKEILRILAHRQLLLVNHTRLTFGISQVTT